jgi:serine/threonine protein kinase/WD40 repeat protein/tetratricopeptide (TPR) repeat protein
MIEPTLNNPPREPRPDQTEAVQDLFVALQMEMLHHWRAGKCVRVEELVQAHPSLRANADAVLDLLYLEVLLREERGESVEVEEYARRFPHLAEPFRELFRVHQALDSGSITVAEAPPRLVKVRSRLAAIGTQSSEGVPRPVLEDTYQSTEAPTIGTPWADLPAIPGYENLELLGRGGMGVVYKARHAQLKRIVALKMTLAGAHSSREDLQRFRREAEAVARLKHPNIVQIYDIGEHCGLPFISLEYVDGGSLAMQQNGTPLPAPAAAQLVETLARAMEYAHGQGIVHRDLNPANVLLQRANNPDPESTEKTGKRLREKEDGPPAPLPSPSSVLSGSRWLASCTPKISDFGLAKHLNQDSRLTETGHVMGTPSYMAPEQVRGVPGAVGPLADVYALGAILYEALVGRPPFQAPTTLEVMNQVAELEPVAPSRFLPGVPHDLEVICLKCLEKDPARRYPSARALADDLRRFLEGVPIQARRVATVERAWRWVKRRPLVAGLLLGVVLALVAGTTISTYFAVKAGQRARDAERAGEEKQRALEDAQKAQRQSDLRSAELLFRTGLGQCESGAVDRGLFTLLEAWRSAPAEAVAFRRVVRTNLAAWSRQLPVLEQILEHPNRKYILTRFVGPDGKILISWEYQNGRLVMRWDPATGQPLGPPFLAPEGEEVVDVSQDGTLLSTAKGLNCRVRDLSTGQLLGSEFRHRVYDQPAWGGVALFCEPSALMVSKSETLGEPQRFRHFWRLPLPRTIGPVESLATIRLEEGDTYHVTAAAGEKPVVVVFRQPPDAAPASAPPQAEFWDMTTGKRLPARPMPPGRSDPWVSWDGRTMVSVSSPEMWGILVGADGAVRRWDTATGQLLGEPWRPRRPAQYSTLAADGQLLVARGQDHRVRLFDLARGLQRGGDISTASFPERDYAPRVGVSPDGSRVATASPEGEVRLWGTRNFLPQVTSAANPRGSASGFPQAPYDHGSLSADGQMGVARVSTEFGVGRLDLAGAETMTAPLRQRRLLHCAFSPDGTIIATAPNNNNFGGKGVVTLWDRTGRPRTLPLDQYRYIHNLAFSRDGRTLAVGCVGGTFLWDVATARLRHFLRETSTAAELLFSPDGTRLAAAHLGGWPGVGAGVRLWDVGTGRSVGAFLAEKHPQRVRPYDVLAFADGGQTLRVFDLLTGTLHALDARTGEARQAPLVLTPAEEAVFSPDGTMLAASQSNGSVQQWDAATGRRVGALLGLPQPAARLCYSPDSQFLAVACRDQSVRVWDAANGAPLGPPLLHRTGVLDLRFTPDGASLVTLTTTGRRRNWPLPKPVADDPERLELWLQAQGGIGFRNQAIGLLDAETWRECRLQLQERWPEDDPALYSPVDEAGWHNARAEDAEEDGNTFAALWHLERLIAQRPHDWRAHARKGLLFAHAGNLDLAESAYRLAAQHAPAEALRNWHRQNATECLIQKQWAMALRHLDWLVAAGGDDWQVAADRATAYHNLNQYAERDAVRARAVQRGADAAFLVPLADEKAAQGQWSEAAALFARAAEQRGLDVLEECHYALTCLKAGDEAGYRRICTRLVGDLGAGGPLTAAFQRGSLSNILPLFRVCGLRADAVADWQPLLKLAEDILAVPMRELALAPEDQLASLRLDWLAARGAVLCRQGRYQEAIPSLQQALGQDGKAGSAVAKAFLAFAHLRLNQKPEASRWVEKSLAPQAGATFTWGALEAELLRPFIDQLRKEISAPDE